MGVIEDDFLGALRAGKQDEARFHLVQLLDELTVEPGNRAHVDALFAKYSDRFAPPTEHDVFPAPEQGAGLDELQDYLADERLRSADSFSRARYERMRDVALRIAAELGHDPKAQARQGPGHRPEKRFAIGRWGLGNYGPDLVGLARDLAPEPLKAATPAWMKKRMKRKLQKAEELAQRLARRATPHGGEADD